MYFFFIFVLALGVAWNATLGTLTPITVGVVCINTKSHFWGGACQAVVEGLLHQIQSKGRSLI